MSHIVGGTGIAFALRGEQLKSENVKNVVDACTWFYRVYPKNPKVRVRSFSSVIAFRIAILFKMHFHTSLHPTTLGTYIYKGSKPGYVAVVTNRGKEYWSTTLFHELIHDQQRALLGWRPYGKLNRTTRYLSNPLEITAERVALELGHLYASGFPPVYMDPCPSSKRLRFANRLGQEAPDFEFTSG